MARRRSSRKSPGSKVTTYPTATTRAGCNRQVYEGRAKKTRGGLTASDLKVNKTGKIVSRRASSAAKKNYVKNGLSVWKYRGTGD